MTEVDAIIASFSDDEIALWVERFGTYPRRLDRERSLKFRESLNDLSLERVPFGLMERARRRQEQVEKMEKVVPKCA